MPMKLELETRISTAEPFSYTNYSRSNLANRAFFDSKGGTIFSVYRLGRPGHVRLAFLPNAKLDVATLILAAEDINLHATVMWQRNPLSTSGNFIDIQPLDGLGMPVEGEVTLQLFWPYEEEEVTGRMTAPKISVPSTAPVNCARCNMKNDYGAPNQADGTYLCFECRP